jgi:hypothetical protein
MTEKELLKLKRSEMLEIMLAQSQEIDNLRKERDELKEKLADRRIRIEKAGSLAEASLQLTNIFVEAQKAADLYVENIKRSAARKKSVAEVHVNEKAAADRSTTMKSAADRLTAENRHNREGKDNG